MPNPAEILILRTPVRREDLVRLVAAYFGDMVKVVVDVERKIIALGGQLHADAELVLLEDGSEQEDLWGANYFPGRGQTDCIEYTALINIRPAQGNRSMEVQDLETRSELRRIIFALVGTGEEL